MLSSGVPEHAPYDRYAGAMKLVPFLARDAGLRTLKEHLSGRISCARCKRTFAWLVEEICLACEIAVLRELERGDDQVQHLTWGERKSYNGGLFTDECFLCGVNIWGDQPNARSVRLTFVYGRGSSYAPSPHAHPACLREALEVPGLDVMVALG